MTMKESCLNTNYKNRKNKLVVGPELNTQTEKYYTDRDTRTCTWDVIMLWRRKVKNVSNNAIHC